MERKSYKGMALAALLIAVVGLSVGLAALSSSLNVAGSGKVVGSKWVVKFANLTTYTKGGNAAEITKPNISGDTTIGTYNVSLKTPGDWIQYTFDITNGGDYTAKIVNFELPTPTCTGDSTGTCAKLKYTLTYTDGGTNVQTNDTWNAGQTKNVTLKLVFDNSATAANLPATDVTINSLGFTINFEKA